MGWDRRDKTDTGQGRRAKETFDYEDEDEDEEEERRFNEATLERRALTRAQQSLRPEIPFETR